MFFFFFNDTATTEIYTLSLHDALPILVEVVRVLLLERETVASHEPQAAVVLDPPKMGSKIGRAHV